MTPINPLVIDTSHWDPPTDWAGIKANGVFGCICKATQGQSYTDPTYKTQRAAALQAGLVWGSYHFGDSTDVQGQVDNFLRFAAPKISELFALDWEDNAAGTMTKDQAQEWIDLVEKRLGRPGECVIYSGNTAKEALGASADAFFGARRLWLAQYGSTPVPQASWTVPWLWQYTDGTSGPTPHNVGTWSGDINSYAGTPSILVSEWASGKAAPAPVEPDFQTITITIKVPVGATVKVVQQ
jgi:GH25 family lysozyme M1 (1,4-beta-N-acetylmuramidase)